ncbi:DUF397 domain-containing protein [Streptomyces mirabilis]|uniref:DUF397 domain-containing protein n=1 Tax=Streptomyces mirabilis TaxID=68239 RepID=UPI0036D7AD71
MSTDETSPELAWFKSSYSGAEGGECLEIAAASRIVHVRDSKEPARAQLTFLPSDWAAFVDFAAGR